MRKIQVLKIDASQLTDEETEEQLEATKATLRLLRPLGVRFGVEEIDGDELTVSVWIEEREPRQPKTRQALGTKAVPAEGASE